MKRRGSGILLHVTSLPAEHGIGDFGREAYHFIDWLTAAAQSYWQILPLTPTNPAHGNSPYSSLSSFALNPILISPEMLAEDGLVSKDDVAQYPDFPEAEVDYDAVAEYKRLLLSSACRNLNLREDKSDFVGFCEENSGWLEDYALFSALKANFNGEVWNKWPAALRDREPDTLAAVRREFQDAIFREKATQYFLFQQWSALKDYCEKKQIRIMGDVPIYVNLDSADVWANPQIFKLNAEKRPEFVAGVPPDYFSRTGQLWGNPVYDWDVLRAQGYRWWVERLRHALHMVDLIRIDHFRGLVAYWQVPAGNKTALKGKWVQAPVTDFLDTLLRHFANLPLVAEDLGMITADVREIVKNYDLPGMKVLQFAFSEDNPAHPYLPHMLERNSVIYTGTHDNNTSRGWFEADASNADKGRFFRYLGREVGADEVSWELLRLAQMSVAYLVICPMQDVLGLGQAARMNTPSTANGNWQWRLLPGQATPELAERLAELTKTYGRA